MFQSGYVTGLDAFLKAVMDYGLTLVFFILTCPLMAMVGLIFWWRDEARIIDRFPVMGRNGRTFLTYKFHTGMSTPASYRSFRRKVPLQNGDSGNSAFQTFLFKTGLDKLPQLINVLKGDMSLVGPRTIPTEEKDRYDLWLPGILAVNPGITGSWALHEARDLEQEMGLMQNYVRSWNIWTDAGILIQTFFELIRTRFRTRLSKIENISELKSPFFNGRVPAEGGKIVGFETGVSKLEKQLLSPVVRIVDHPHTGLESGVAERKQGVG